MNRQVGLITAPKCHIAAAADDDIMAHIDLLHRNRSGEVSLIIERNTTTGITATAEIRIVGVIDQVALNNHPAAAMHIKLLPHIIVNRVVFNRDVG